MSKLNRLDEVYFAQLRYLLFYEYTSNSDDEYELPVNFIAKLSAKPIKFRTVLKCKVGHAIPSISVYI